MVCRECGALCAATKIQLSRACAVRLLGAACGCMTVAAVPCQRACAGASPQHSRGYDSTIHELSAAGSALRDAACVVSSGHPRSKSRLQQERHRLPGVPAAVFALHTSRNRHHAHVRQVAGCCTCRASLGQALAVPTTLVFGGCVTVFVCHMLMGSAWCVGVSRCQRRCVDTATALTSLLQPSVLCAAHSRIPSCWCRCYTAQRGTLQGLLKPCGGALAGTHAASSSAAVPRLCWANLHASASCKD
jgi:hypothetical protein